jgi:hypothetical protein
MASVTPPAEAFRMLSTADGGRREAILSGFRCPCWIGTRTQEGDKAYNDAAIWLESQQRLEPGESAMARLQPGVPAYWSHVDVGFVIELYDPWRVVGEAKVVELLPVPGR